MRRTELDAMRVVAIMLVLLNHLPVYTQYYIGHGLDELGYLLTALITRVNVPLFAMVSGVLLLGREENFAQLWRRRILRMILVVVIFQGLLYLQRCLSQNQGVELWTFACGVLTGQREGYVPYWFLYAYLGFLMMLPYLRQIARCMTKADFWYLLVLHFLLISFPKIINFFLHFAGVETFTLSKHLLMPLTCISLLFYPLMGFYLDRHVDVMKISARQWTYLIATAVVGLTIAGGMTLYQGCEEKFSQTYIADFSYVTTIVVFLLIKRMLVNNRSTIVSSFFSFAGSLCFGIYLLDNNLKEWLWSDFSKALSPILSKYMMSLLWIAFSMTMCGATTWILKKLPGLKRLL